MKKSISLLSVLLLSTLLMAQLKVGDKATDFTLKNIDDKNVSLSDYSDSKGVIVIFTCNHCPYAKLYEDRIVEISKVYKQKGFPIIAINPNNPKEYEEDSFENMKIRAKDKGFDFPYLLDNVGVYKQYGATKTPHIYLLSTNKTGFKVEYIGAIDDNARDASAVSEKYLENAIAALENGKKIEVTETKAIGCSIKPY